MMILTLSDTSHSTCILEKFAKVEIFQVVQSLGIWISLNQNEGEKTKNKKGHLYLEIFT